LKKGGDEEGQAMIGLFGRKVTLWATTMGSKKDDEGIYYNNKTTIIQEARVFNESPINPRKCRSLLTRIVYLLYTGDAFATHEATSLFFGTTKLFQHKDVRFPSLSPSPHSVNGIRGSLLFVKPCILQSKSYHQLQRM
jgi:hypothetical protein